MAEAAPLIAAPTVRRSLLLSFGEKYSSLLIQFITSLVVTRLITPQGFGVFSIAFAIVGFAHVIRDMGVNSYLVQRPHLGPDHIRAGLFATGVVAWGLGFALIAANPLVGRLYGNDVGRAEFILSFSFFVQPFSSTIVAVLQREMDFAALLRINLIGACAHAACAIVLSLAGWSYLGLAYASVFGQAVTSMAAAFYRPQVEHFLPSIRGAGEVLRFGSGIMLSSLLQQFSTNIASLITARFVSLGAIGVLDRAQSVTGLYSRLIMEAVQPLVLPVISGLRRTGQDVGGACWHSLDYIAVVAWPFFVFLSVCAEPIIVVLFGPRWSDAVPLLRLISIGGVFWVVQPVAQPLLIALGRVKAVLAAQAVNQTIAVAGVLIAAPHGIIAVAAAAIAISALHAATWLAYLRTTVHLGWRVAGIAVRAAAITAAAVALPIGVICLLPQLASLPKLALAAAGFGAGWLTGVLVTGHPLAGELVLLSKGLAFRVPLMRRALRAAGD